jgi:hypothetical protein
MAWVVVKIEEDERELVSRCRVSDFALSDMVIAFILAPCLLL